MYFSPFPKLQLMISIINFYIKGELRIASQQLSTGDFPVSTMMILHLLLLLASSVYLTNAMCACTGPPTFDESVCYADYAVLATVKEDQVTPKKYNLDVIRNFKTDKAPTAVVNKNTMECVKELESGKTYILAGSIENGMAMISACDFSLEINENSPPPPTPICTPMD